VDLILSRRDRVLAVLFGAVSVPWTYLFVVGGLALWPSFIASASFYAADESLERSLGANAVGIAYAAATLALVSFVGGEAVVLSVVVGAFMFIASLNDAVGLYTPGGFFGYATLFSVHAANSTVFGLSGLAGETAAAVLSMFVGAFIGLGTARLRDRFA
jgi:hypothetical protein